MRMIQAECQHSCDMMVVCGIAPAVMVCVTTELSATELRPRPRCELLRVLACTSPSFPFIYCCTGALCYLLTACLSACWTNKGNARGLSRHNTGRAPSTAKVELSLKDYLAGNQSADPVVGHAVRLFDNGAGLLLTNWPHSAVYCAVFLQARVQPIW